MLWGPGAARVRAARREGERVKISLIAQMGMAGALVGFLIGPNSLDEFIGIIPNNPVVLNVLVGALVGAALGVLGSLAKEID